MTLDRTSRRCSRPVRGSSIPPRPMTIRRSVGPRSRPGPGDEPMLTRSSMARERGRSSAPRPFRSAPHRGEPTPATLAVPDRCVASSARRSARRSLPRRPPVSDRSPLVVQLAGGGEAQVAQRLPGSVRYGRAGAVANGLARTASAINANAARRTNARRRFRRVTPADGGAAVPGRGRRRRREARWPPRRLIRAASSSARRARSPP